MSVNATDNATANSAEITIAHGEWSARIGLRGAALLQLWADTTEIVSSAWPNSADWFAGSTLAPWPNRLDAGTWQHSGKTLHAPINDTKNNCANHGLVYDHIFEVVQKSESQVELSTVIHDEAAYPFQVRINTFFELTEFGLRCVITAKNEDTEPAPFAVGVHPYFVTDPASILTFDAHEQIEVDDRMLPTSKLLATTPGSETRTIRLNNRADFTDTCFGGLTRYAEGFAQAFITRPLRNQRVVVFQNQDFNYLQVFTLMNTESSGGNTLVALEPQSAPANALNTGDGLVWLEPGQIWSGTWGVDIESDIE